MLRTPSPVGAGEAYNSSALSRARSVPLKEVSKSSEDIDTTAATKSFDMTSSSTTRHYTVVATDCRRSMLSGNNTQYQQRQHQQPLSDHHMLQQHHRMLQSRRASCLSGSGGSSECQTVAAGTSSISFGSFGGNDADHEDNVEDEDDPRLENLAEENYAGMRCLNGTFP